jgi:hypothetical protein
MKSLSTKQLILAGIAIFLSGVALSAFRQQLHNPMKPLYVEIYNNTKEILPSVEIEHGGHGLQEKIMLIRLKPEERRIVALNHKPGLGFNVAANYAHREKSEICGGKSKDVWFFRETITPHGIYTTPLH